jgi:UDP-N-acetylglucosamine transferase subunit ALG13
MKHIIERMICQYGENQTLQVQLAIEKEEKSKFQAMAMECESLRATLLARD